MTTTHKAAVVATALFVAMMFWAPARGREATSLTPPACDPGTPAPAEPVKPPHPITFGVTAAGQIHSTTPASVPEDPARTVAALKELASGRPLVARIHHVWFADGKEAIKQAVRDAHRYTRAGMRVSVQLRYGKVGGFTPTPDGYATWLRMAVRRLGRVSGVRSLEIGNEFNLIDQPESSDGFYPDALEALVDGMIAADDAARKGGFERIKLGFTWFYQSDPSREEEFWTFLRDAGDRFRVALDWVGMNAYPGTFEFPRYVPRTPHPLVGQELVRGATLLRNCYMTLAEIPASTPIRITENSYPMGMGRTEDDQASALSSSVDAIRAYSGDLNVTDYWYFTLRDVSSGSLKYESNYGLLKSDYSPKAAFDAYRTYVQRS